MQSRAERWRAGQGSAAGRLAGQCVGVQGRAARWRAGQHSTAGRWAGQGRAACRCAGQGSVAARMRAGQGSALTCGAGQRVGVQGRVAHWRAGQRGAPAAEQGSAQAAGRVARGL
ncbi:unnamed protein product [Closterium sp. NIES-64]|nr:unnamed protein product [Closterium sp. NIES-64]